MAAGKTKSMGEIDDIREMFQLMVALGIPSKGLIKVVGRYEETR